MARGWKYDSIKKTTPDGSIYESTKEYYIPVTEQDFYMTFIENTAPIYGLTSATDIKVLIELCGKAEYNTGKVNLTPKGRVEISERLKCTIQSVTNAIRSLKKNKIIDGSRGDYIINSNIFWKGKLTERRKVILNFENSTHNKTKTLQEKGCKNIEEELDQANLIREPEEKYGYLYTYSENADKR